ncbi:hypothetical protein NM208_g15772 [Fusarium decemcellulare]|uniref:Uncharacterized protein n=1 Tax=Fusarium decemcellulare TaxID=57161 RepID=A0ACC1REQ4_9HYPO|nr:hypothetical protein NM208_g15772 [Fusarium decemcellulare]
MAPSTRQANNLDGLDNTSMRAPSQLASFGLTNQGRQCRGKAGQDIGGSSRACPSNRATGIWHGISCHVMRPGRGSGSDERAQSTIALPGELTAAVAVPVHVKQGHCNSRDSILSPDSSNVSAVVVFRLALSLRICDYLVAPGF